MSKLTVIVLCLLTGLPIGASAQCVVGFGLRESAGQADVVFSGLVTGVGSMLLAGQPSPVLNIKVDRVWKGTVPKRVRIHHVRAELEHNPIDFKTNTRYVVFGRATTVEEQALFAKAGVKPEAWVIDPCGGGTRLLAEAESHLSELGPAHRPRQTQ